MSQCSQQSDCHCSFLMLTYKSSYFWQKKKKNKLIFQNSKVLLEKWPWYHHDYGCNEDNSNWKFSLFPNSAVQNHRLNIITSPSFTFLILSEQLATKCQLFLMNPHFSVAYVTLIKLAYTWLTTRWLAPHIPSYPSCVLSSLSPSMFITSS